MQWYVIGSVAALLTMFGFVPQVMKMVRTKSVEDVSVVMLTQFSMGTFLWFLYGVHLADIIIIIANLVTFVSVIAAMVLYLYYKNQNEPKDKTGVAIR